jgi:hypothetical protein
MDVFIIISILAHIKACPSIHPSIHKMYHHFSEASNHDIMVENQSNPTAHSFLLTFTPDPNNVVVCWRYSEERAIYWDHKGNQMYRRLI